MSAVDELVLGAEIDVPVNAEVEALEEFLARWDQNYNEQVKSIDLFKENLTSKWNMNQKQLFIKILYHQRAHFSDVLWFIGNFAPNAASKEMILNNIRDEFGKHAPSHEQLYLDFSKSMGVDLKYELIEENFYYPFLRDYNRGHLRWLRNHDWEHNLAAFAAIERLDNVDYVVLRNVVASWGISARDLIFFNVHIYVTHYDDLANSAFSDLWQKKPQLVKKVFEFIGEYQIGIWKRISDAVFDNKY